jgi:hypothetical protein
MSKLFENVKSKLKSQGIDLVEGIVTDAVREVCDIVDTITEEVEKVSKEKTQTTAYEDKHVQYIYDKLVKFYEPSADLNEDNLELLPSITSKFIDYEVEAYRRTLFGAEFLYGEIPVFVEWWNARHKTAHQINTMSMYPEFYLSKEKTDIAQVMTEFVIDNPAILTKIAYLFNK